MPVFPYLVKFYESQKKESIIRGSQCFFLIQLHKASNQEIEPLREKTFPLGLRLRRFPLINWQETSLPHLKAAQHIPVQTSNYVLLGEKKLNPEELRTLSTIIQEEEVIFIFGCQENVWLNAPRLVDCQELISLSSQKIVLEVLHSPISPLLLILQQLQQNLEILSYKLK